MFILYLGPPNSDLHVWLDLSNLKHGVMSRDVISLRVHFIIMYSAYIACILEVTRH